MGTYTVNASRHGTKYIIWILSIIDFESIQPSVVATSILSTVQTGNLKPRSFHLSLQVMQ